MKLEVLDNINYNTTVVEASDQAAIEAYGPVPANAVTAHTIIGEIRGRQVAQVMLQRLLFHRNTFTFRLSLKHALLEPMDLVTLTDPGLGLLSGSLADAASYNTLAWVDGECISYQTATLTGAGQYDLTTLFRGVYGTQNTSHAVGSRFVRLDGALYRHPYTPERIGQTLHVKLVSFNVYGGGGQSLADVTAYTHIITGPPAPLAPTNPAAVARAGGIHVTWTADPAANTAGYRVTEGSTLLASVTTNSFVWQHLNVGTYTFHIETIDTAGRISDTAAVASVTIAAPSAPAGLTAQVIDNNVELRWTGVPGTLPIVHYQVSRGSMVVGTVAVTFDFLQQSAPPRRRRGGERHYRDITRRHFLGDLWHRSTIHNPILVRQFHRRYTGGWIVGLFRQLRFCLGRQSHKLQGVPVRQHRSASIGGVLMVGSGHRHLSSGSQLFTSSGTFTVPAGITSVRVTIVSCGGSGGGACANANTSGAGAPGYVLVEW